LQLKNQVFKKLVQVDDPELGVNIVDLGLIYNVEVDGGDVEIEMTMTSPMCPLAGQIVHSAEAKVEELAEVDGVEINMVYDPPWTPERMSNKAKEKLGSL